MNNDRQSISLQDYQVFPQHVGQWEGTVRFLDANLQETKRYQISQAFDDAGDKWVITNTYTYGDGTSYSHSFDVIPIGNREVKLMVNNDSRFANYDLSALEHGNNIIDFKIFNRTTGILSEIETITITGDRRLRTTQFFTETGDFKNLLVVVEHRVK